MRVCYIAPFEHDYGTEEHVAWSFEMLGHEVRRVKERGADSWSVYQATDSCELVLYTKGVGLPDDVTNIWRDLEESPGTHVTASFTLDLFRGLPREAEVGTNPFWTTGTVFSADGDPDTQAWMAERGVNHCWLPPACVSDECVRVEPGVISENVAEIVFVGSTRAYHADWPWRMEMLDGLRARYGQRFATFGPQDGNTTRGLALNALLQTPGRIVIGDSLALPGHSFYWSDRIVETLGRGGFLLFPRIPGIQEFFTDWIHLRYYEPGDMDSLFALIDLYLDAPEAARAMANAGQAHVAAHHTYRDRCSEMLRVLGLEQ